MRRMFLVITLVAMFSILSGCTPLAFAGAALVFRLGLEHIEKQEHTRHIEKQEHERLCREAEEKVRIQREQLASRQAEELRQRQLEDAERRRREEQERLSARSQQAERNREQLALLHDEAKRHAASLADVRRELGEIVEGAIDIEKKLLGAKLNGPNNPPLGKEQDHGNQ